MNKTILMTATIASLAVNVFAADNNFIGGTNNTVTNNAKSVGVVGYQNTVGGNNAVAFGVFARPNERIMLGFGATLGAEKQYNVSVAFKTGKGSDYVQEAKDAQSRISKLEALVNQLVEEVNAQKGI